MKNAKLSLILILIAVSADLAQSLYIPLEFEEAYEDGTRSLDGKPGTDYWQNKSDYVITVELDPVKSTISGTAEITYYNNSPDTLDRIVLRLYQNIHKKGTVKDFPFDKDEFTDGMNIQSHAINKKNIDLADTSVEKTGTNLIIKNLNIPPDNQTVINVSWDFKIPKENTIRMGQYDTTTFFIAYWYPQVAVYDDIDGWDMIEYTGQAEFYNDFNNYDVKITIPNYYGVWATGELKNPEAVLAPQIFERYRQAMISSTNVNIITAQDYLTKMAVFNNQNQTSTWHFFASSVPDFSFGCAANYLWDGMTANGGAGKSVFVNAAYNPASLDFYEMCDVVTKTVEMLSKNLPGVPFPFPKIAVFNGKGGVETPMMVNQSSTRQRIWMVHTTVHEVVHSYFPFYMGINERKYAWMDEGFTQMLSEYIQFELDKTIDFRARNVKRYLDNSGQFDEVPMMYPSNLIRGEMYGNQAYFRPCNALNILKDFIGDTQFKKALQEYMKRWAGKHPTPYDFFFTFEDVLDDELDWFWQPWFFRQAYPDIGIDTALFMENNLVVKITKQGELPIPVVLKVKFKDGSDTKVYRSASVWRPSGGEDEDEITIEMETERKVLSLELGNEYIPDADTTNDYWIFK
ncbi:MAG: M1 family metallopeptidase [Chlorobi bacterium]|nr:M1 family metallopeptidase [Chlorobiota bacterium]MCI0715259.1 M1 family metallopeptidase [Chlorobiota bacterium]